MNLSDIAIPDEAAALIQLCREQKQRVILSQPIGGDCPNCGGIGHLNLDVILAGPTANLFTGRVVSLLLNNQWYIGKRHQFPCPICNGNRSVAIAALWEHSGLVHNERGWCLDYIEGMAGKEQALGAARAMLAQTPQPAGWLCLYGDYGVGKSGILKSLVGAFIRAEVSARYISAFDLLESVKATFGDDAEQRAETVYARFSSYRFLAIDEVDRIPSRDWSQMALTSVLDRRYNDRHYRATAIVTNADPEQMGEQWAYLMSRMRDAVRALVGGSDLRGDG